MKYPESLNHLIERIRQLPGVGEKTAERYAFALYEMEKEDAVKFAKSIVDMKNKVQACSICGNMAEQERCSICSSKQRDHTKILVVQSPKDIIAIENMGEYEGVYHVLNGLISASKGILPEDLRIKELLVRAKEASEIILAMSATLDGETTSLYLTKVLDKEYPHLLVTRIAHGLPSGAMLDYADEITLSHALAERRKVKE
ncbi:MULTISPECIES: recombination mediator RecR [Terrabacteria group]|uniref:recombination mediator RecR n=1 Tax=Bacillati TaxID=1783272 RepID=UPI001C6E81B9|nr:MULTISPECIES: recombination mediator RecR [Terrabacteria group]MBW9212494.1 recombination mediator RecR [Trueperella sp. zg.1013]